MKTISLRRYDVILRSYLFISFLQFWGTFTTVNSNVDENGMIGVSLYCTIACVKASICRCCTSPRALNKEATLSQRSSEKTVRLDVTRSTLQWCWSTCRGETVMVTDHLKNTGNNSVLYIYCILFYMLNCRCRPICIIPSFSYGSPLEADDPGGKHCVVAWIHSIVCFLLLCKNELWLSKPIWIYITESLLCYLCMSATNLLFTMQNNLSHKDETLEYDYEISCPSSVG